MSFIKDNISPSVIVSSILRKSGQYFSCVFLVNNYCDADAILIFVFYKFLRKKTVITIGSKHNGVISCMLVTVVF